MADVGWVVGLTALMTMVVTWQWQQVAGRWQRGRSLLTVSERIEREHCERLSKL
ncbi:MAG TPA: hypothetical protein GX400_22985 [Chloroflexi bacterium]|nr:hypothetical protein [Chloroflexota bacterium]